MPVNGELIWKTLIRVLVRVLALLYPATTRHRETYSPGISTAGYFLRLAHTQVRNERAAIIARVISLIGNLILSIERDVGINRAD